MVQKVREIVFSKFNTSHFIKFLVLDGISLVLIFWVSLFAYLFYFGANHFIQNHWTAVIGSDLLLFVLLYKSYKRSDFDKSKNYILIFLLNWLGIIFEEEIAGFIDGLL